MLQIRTLCVLGLTMLTSVLACGGRTEPQRIGGETNWFQWCGADADCREGVCACGLCTERCSAEAPSCDAGPPGSSCVLPNGGGFPGLCAEPSEAGLCLVSCSLDADCGQGLRCVGRLCLAEAASITGPTGPTGSVSGSTSLCAEDPVLPDGRYTITTQEDLERLRGCTSVDALDIRHDTVTDLSPLGSLRVVRTGLTIVAVEANWSPAELTLAGLQSLERVAYLQLSGFADTDLGVLRNLTRVDDLYLADFPNLTALDALSQLRVEKTLTLRTLPALRSLSGSTIASGARVILAELGSLQDLRALSSASWLDYLEISDVGVQTLDDLHSIERLGQGSFGYNAALRNVDGLNSLTTADTLTFVSDPELENLDGLSRLGTLGYLLVEDNPKLTHLADFAALTSGDFMVIGNPRLQTGPNCPLLEAADLFFRSNAVLADLSFSALGFSDGIDISDNASLTQVALPSLRYVKQLQIRDNASLSRLDVSGLRGLSQMALSGNPSLLEQGITAHPDVAVRFGVPPAEPSAP